MSRATKIVATIGPASSDRDTLTRMIRAGVDVVRLNFSHGKPQDHIDRATLVLTASVRTLHVHRDPVGPLARCELSVVMADLRGAVLTRPTQTVGSEPGPAAAADPAAPGYRRPLAATGRAAAPPGSRR